MVESISADDAKNTETPGANPGAPLPAEARFPRQLVICCDGTNNNLTGRVQDTNVVKLAQLLANHANPSQLTFYDPGVGNPGNPDSAPGPALDLACVALQDAPGAAADRADAQQADVDRLKRGLHASSTGPGDGALRPAIRPRGCCT